MPFVLLNDQGEVVAVSELPQQGYIEMGAADQRVQRFLAGVFPGSAMDEADVGFVRVLEDVVELLINKNLILFTELPEAARNKILSRKRLRGDLVQPLNLLGDEE